MMFIAYSLTVELGGGFQGHVSQVYMWNRELAYDIDVSTVSSSAHVLITDGLLLAWGDYVLAEGVQRIAPTRYTDPDKPLLIGSSNDKSKYLVFLINENHNQ